RSRTAVARRERTHRIPTRGTADTPKLSTSQRPPARFRPGVRDQGRRFGAGSPPQSPPLIAFHSNVNRHRPWLVLGQRPEKFGRLYQAHFLVYRGMFYIANHAGNREPRPFLSRPSDANAAADRVLAPKIFPRQRRVHYSGRRRLVRVVGRKK